MKMLFIVVCLFVQTASHSKADITITASRSFNLAGSILPDELKQTAEKAYRAALNGNINILRSKISSSRNMQFQAADIELFSAALLDPRFCALLTGFQGTVSGASGERGYLLILNVIGGEPDLTYSLSSFIHIWYLDGPEWKLMVPNLQLFAPFLRQDTHTLPVMPSDS